MAKHLPDRERKEQLIGHALKIATHVGYQSVTRSQIARAAAVSDATISVHLGTMQNLRRTIMRHAIAGRVLPVIAQGLAAGDSLALRAPEELRRAAAASIAQ